MIKKVSPHWLWFGLILAVGALFRFGDLGNIIFYWDEPLHCIRIAAQPLPFVLAHNDASAFFALLVHLLLPLGKLEVMARLPSTLFGIGSIAAVYFLGRELFSRREGLIASLLVAFSPLLIRYSQYSRAYSTYIFLSLLSFYFFFKSIKKNRTQDWVLYCLITTLNLYNHLFAFFLLPVFGILAVARGLTGWRGRFSPAERKIQLQPLLRFVLWTLLILMLVVLLYLPDQGARAFLSDSLARATVEASQEDPVPFPLDVVLRNLLTMKNSFFFIGFLLLAFLGIVAIFKKDRWTAALVLLYLFLPYALFLLINPSPAHMESVWRYMAYSLPLFLLLSGKGMITLFSAAASFMKRLKTSLPFERVLERTLTLLLLFFFLFAGFAHKSYYLEFKRLNNLKIPKSSTSFLEKNVKRDAFVFFDSFPASNLILLVNPLTKGLRVEEFEIPIREDLVAKEESHKIMLYKVRQQVLDWYIHKNIDLWAGLQLAPHNLSRLQLQVEAHPHIKDAQEQEHTFLHFEGRDTPLWIKLNQMTQILLSLDLHRDQKADLHLISARALLLAGHFEEAVDSLRKSRQMTGMSSFDTDRPPLLHRLLDLLFGLDPRQLRQLAHDTYLYSDLAKLLIRFGDLYRQQQSFHLALQAYDECAKISPDYRLRISNRLAAMANAHINSGQEKEALLFLEKSVELNPQRTDLEFLYGDILRKLGDTSGAVDKYKEIFATGPISAEIQDRLLQSDPLLIIWRKEASLVLIFRSVKRARLTGRIDGNRVFRQTQNPHWTQSDSLKLLRKKLSFDVELSGGAIKFLEIQTSKKSKYTIDLFINGSRQIRKILVMDNGFRPTSLPIRLD